MRKKKKEIIKSADIALMPMVENIQNKSRCPMKLTEYMALGSAIVANNVGEVKHILNGAGLLVGQSEKSFARAIVQLIENKNLRRKLKRKVRQRIKNFDWNVLVEKIEPFYYPC